MNLLILNRNFSSFSVALVHKLYQRLHPRHKTWSPLAATRQTIQPLEGALLHSHQRLPALLPARFRRRQDIGDGAVPLQGQARGCRQGPVGEQEDIQRGGLDTGQRREDLFEGPRRAGRLVRTPGGVHVDEQRKKKSLETFA